MIALLIFLVGVGGMVAFGPADQWPDKEYPHLTIRQVREYKALEEFLTRGGGTEMIGRRALKVCGDNAVYNLVDGKEFCTPLKGGK